MKNNYVYKKDTKIINDKIFKRYYHHDHIKTRYFVSKDGDIYSGISDKILQPNKTVKGYHKVGVYINNKNKPVSVHKIVATVYCGGY